MTGLRTRLDRLERAAARRHPQPADVPLTDEDMHRAITIARRRLAGLNAGEEDHYGVQPHLVRFLSSVVGSVDEDPRLHWLRDSDALKSIGGLLRKATGT